MKDRDTGTSRVAPRALQLGPSYLRITGGATASSLAICTLFFAARRLVQQIERLRARPTTEKTLRCVVKAASLHTEIIPSVLTSTVEESARRICQRVEQWHEKKGRR